MSKAINPIQELSLLCELNQAVSDDSMRMPDDAPVHCEEFGCDWVGIASNCETEMDSEGWEYPEYEVLVCPKCGEYSIMY